MEFSFNFKTSILATFVLGYFELDGIELNYRVRKVAQAARRLATGWTARVRSRVSEECRFFFIPSCTDWSGCKSGRA